MNLSIKHCDEEPATQTARRFDNVATYASELPPDQSCRPVRRASAVALPAESKAAECSCEAHFELRAPSNGRPAFDPSFKPDIPVDHFRVGLGQGAGTMNGCRREAQHRAHSCMTKVWANRMNPDDEPVECSASRGIHGSVPYDIKR
jgi:hypothetical protein